MVNSEDIKQTFKHAFIYSIAGVLQKAVGFIMLPIYTHFLRGEGYGIIGMIDVVFSVLTVLAGYGIASALQRFYYENRTDAGRHTLVSTAILATFIVVIIVCIPAFLLNKQIALFAFGKSGLEYYVTLTVITFIAEMTSMTAGSYILVRQQSILYSLLSLLRLVIGILLNIYLIVYLKLGVLGFLYSNLIVSSIMTLIMHAYALFQVGIHFDKEDAKKILKFSLPLLPGYVAMFVRNNADRVIIRTLLGLSSVGIFELLFKFVFLIEYFLFDPFLKIWIPKRFEICDSEDGPQIVAKYFTFELALALFFGLFLSLEIPLLIKILAPEEFWIPDIFAFLAVFSRILLHSYYHFIFGLLYSNLTYKISIIQVLCAILSVLFNIVFIKLYGLAGALVSICLVYLFQAFIAHILSKRYYSIPFEWWKILKMIATVVILFVCINSISLTQFGIDNWYHQEILPFLINCIKFLHLENFKDGKLMIYFVDKSYFIVEAIIKALLSLTFLICLLFIGLLPKKQIFKIIRTRSIWHPTRTSAKPL